MTRDKAPLRSTTQQVSTDYRPLDKPDRRDKPGLPGGGPPFFDEFQPLHQKRHLTSRTTLDRTEQYLQPRRLRDSTTPRQTKPNQTRHTESFPSTMPAPTALLQPAPAPKNVPLPAPQDDDELLVDMQQATTQPDAAAAAPPQPAQDTTDMAIDEEGRPKFAPGKDIVCDHRPIHQTSRATEPR
jgi:hypothetical protein